VREDWSYTKKAAGLLLEDASMKVAVTGAYGYSGRYVAARLLAGGHTVLTLTNSPARANPFGEQVPAVPFNFDRPDLLTESLRGVDALINTYWVRFDHRLFTHEQAVANTRVLFQAARAAGVRRIVHVSITKPDINSDLPYFRGKAQLEAELVSLGVPYCILRPTVLFGREDILINNIAWAIRHMPAVIVFGSGDYRLQPIHVDDLAAAAVEQASSENPTVIEAVGPETFKYRDLIAMMADTIGQPRRIVRVPPAIGYWACRMLGMIVHDNVITREEIQGLMEERLYVDAPALGTTRLSHWVRQHRDTLGQRYTSEMARRLNRGTAYRSN
jgi:NADH dehydrogenase